MTRKPVMADVARLAGVSHQTVSRVINGSPSIRPDTRQRVEHAIAQLGYRPNTAARALVTNRSGIIGIIGSNTGQYGPTSIQRAVEEAARDAGYFSSTVTLASVSHQEIRGAVDHLSRLSVESIVMVAAQQDALNLVRSEDFGVPVIVVEGDLSGVGPSVGVDQVGGARKATQHLIDLGHTAIAYVSGPPNWPEAAGRTKGYLDAMMAARLVPRPDWHGDWSAARGYAIGQQIADQHDITAVFVANDQMAIGILHALAEAGRSVPGDVSVVGFDDIPEAAYLIPSLTTVRQDFAAVGHRAITLVAAQLSGTEAETALLPADLVVRDSTAPPGGRSGGTAR
ncbi:LacI family DNA-binding transcriptional regulator [Mycobacterium sp. 21AC1]|uniref:LacI family DNA-binding transcriptional regulator n=1 Tax=[Mycobacterium] appelbergii TaxID=2939269 RepID=UPI0029393F05|nr:LacI family DNA-binding transcriptional regulator [Mycobacterium sp. 21AC1]MDV3126654.1 LacI family DNA-binding transcriptional regulator [Mycobacterium sp. 21AC1]